MWSTSKNDYPLADVFSLTTPLVFGCMGLGGEWGKSSIGQKHIQQAQEVIESALESGIRVFDHADIYTFGKAETAFGKVLSQQPSLRDQIILQSKCGIRFSDEYGVKRYDLSSQWIIQSVDASLARLHTDHLDILLLHRPDPLMDIHDIAEAFLQLKSQGKVSAFGVSNMQAHQIAFLQSALSDPLRVNQIQLSLLHRDWLEEGVMVGSPQGEHVNFTPGTLQYCQQNRVQVQAWGALAQGVFSGRDVTGEAESVRQTAALVAKLAGEYQVSAEAIVLAWLMRHPANIQPVIGTVSRVRLRACSEVHNMCLSREHWYELFVTARGQALP